MRYVAGYVQSKTKKHFPSLTIPEGDVEPGRWIENLSRGGLTIPSSALLSLCQTMETEFCRFHGNKINKCPKPIETLVEKIMLNKQPSRVLHYVCQLYVKVRFFNRLKFLNIQIKAKEASERIRNDTLIFIFVFVFISMISTSGGENL